MEQTQTSEDKFRLNLKQNSKGNWYGEFTVRGDTIEEIHQRAEEIKKEMLSQLKNLNV